MTSQTAGTQQTHSFGTQHAVINIIVCARHLYVSNDDHLNPLRAHVVVALWAKRTHSWRRWGDRDLHLSIFTSKVSQRSKTLNNQTSQDVLSLISQQSTFSI
jgi:hypothetical protein